MSARRFRISTPEQLRELSVFATEGKLSAAISVWTAAKRRMGASHWDRAFYACFSGDRDRNAEIVRIDAGGELQHCATPRYNQALRWCERNLHEVS